MSSQPQLPPETDMNTGDVTYEATPRWLADLVLKASRLMGRYPGLLDTAEQREHATAFTSVFMLRMAMGEAATDEAHDAVYCMSQLRKAIGFPGTPICLLWRGKPGLSKAERLSGGR